MPWLGLSGRDLLQHTVIPALSYNGAVQRTVQEYRDCLQDMLLLTDDDHQHSSIEAAVPDSSTSSSSSSRHGGSAKQQQQQQQQQQLQNGSAERSVFATATVASGLVELARSGFDSPAR